MTACAFGAFVFSQYSASAAVLCENPSYQEEIQIPKELQAKDNLDQEDTGTCYAFTAKRQLDALLRSLGIQDEIPVSEVIGQGGNRRLIEGGVLDSVLLNLRTKKLRRGKTLPVSSIFRYQNELAKMNAKTCEYRVKDILEEAGMSTIGDVNQVVSQLERSSSTFAYDSLELSLASEHAERSELPPFNIYQTDRFGMFRYVQELEAKKGKRFSKIEDFNARSDFISNQLHDLLKNGQPVGLGFNTGTGLHAVLIEGSRNVCCVLGKNQTCWPEWKIKNSYGGGKEGWCDAQPMLKGWNNFTQIRPCGPKREECQEDVIGKENRGLILTENEDLLKEQLKKFPERINKLDKEGRTLLHYVSKVINPKIKLKFSKILMEMNANPNQKDNFGQTPIQAAIENGDLETARFLIDHSTAAQKQKIELRPLFEEFISRYPNSGLTKLKMEKSPVLPEFLSYLLKLGFNPNQQLTDGTTPLFRAMLMEFNDYVPILIKSGARIDTLDKNGDPLLLSLARSEEINKKDTFFRYLKKFKPNMEVQDQEGKTPLQVAVQKGHKNTCKKLIELGAKVNVVDHRGWSPLAEAIHQNNYELATILLEGGANPKFKFPDGTNLFDLAKKSRLKESFFELLNENKYLRVIKRAIRKAGSRLSPWKRTSPTE